MAFAKIAPASGAKLANVLKNVPEIVCRQHRREATQALCAALPSYDHYDAFEAPRPLFARKPDITSLLGSNRAGYQPGARTCPASAAQDPSASNKRNPLAAGSTRQVIGNTVPPISPETSVSVRSPPCSR